MGQATEDIVMELDGEGTANFEQLKDLIHKECDKQDCCYAQLEDKYKKLEHQVTNQDQQNNMAKSGQQPTSDGPGASKKKQIRTKASLKPTKQSPKKRTPKQHRSNKPKKIQKPRMSHRKQQQYKVKKENKPPSPSQNKSEWNQCNAPGRKKLPWKQQRKN